MLGADPKLQRMNFVVEAVNQVQLSVQLHDEEYDQGGLHFSVAEVIVGDVSIGWVRAESRPSFPATVSATKVVISNQQTFLILAEVISDLGRSQRHVAQGHLTNSVVGFKVETGKRAYYLSVDQGVRKPTGFEGLMQCYVEDRTPEGYVYRHCLYDGRWPLRQGLQLIEGTYGTYAATTVELQQTGTVVYEFSDVRNLTVRDPMTWQYAYRRGRFVNGRPALVAGRRNPIPLQKPSRGEWDEWSSDIHLLRSLTQSNLDRLAVAAEGLYPDVVWKVLNSGGKLPPLYVLEEQLGTLRGQTG